MQEREHDIFRTYKWGRSLVGKKDWPKLSTQMYNLNIWYMDMCKPKKDILFIVRYNPEHWYWRGYGIMHVMFEKLQQLLWRDALDKSLMSC
jgi:hypothetical protein